MAFLATQLRQVAPYYSGEKPLPKRLERLARDLAAGEHDIATIARRSRVSADTVHRLKQHAAVRSRVACLAERFAEAAQQDEPLARKGNRIALAGQMARTLKDQLEANGYVTTLGVSKQGNPIVGFDRARVAEIRHYLALIADELEDKTVKQATDTLAVQVTMTTADAVTKVQALLSRTADDTDIEEGARAHAREGEATPTPYALGVPGGTTDTDTIGEIGDGSLQTIDQNLGAKAAEPETDHNKNLTLKGEALDAEWRAADADDGDVEG